MIYNAIVAANFSLPLKLSENAHCRVVNDQVVYPFLLMADIGESLLTSLFTFFLISIRLNS